MTGITPTILFVDDEEHVLNGLKRHVKRKCPNWTCLFETDPVRAIDILKENTVSLVISDYRMPVMNGVDMLVTMRSIKPDLPAIMLTGSGEVATAVDAINDAQVAKFFTKPIEFENLMQGIQIVLNATGEVSNHHVLAFRQALDVIAPAVMMVDRSAKLIHANKSAAKHLEKGNGFLLDNASIIRGARLADSNKLHDCIQNMFDTGGLEKRVLKLSSLDGETDFHAVLVHLPNGDAVAKHIMIVLHQGDNENYDFTHDMMKELFGLTPSESRLVIALSAGEKLDEAAVSAGLTISSARTYMKRIFEKTGVNRQADLVKMIASSPVKFVSQEKTLTCS
jgi:DNA-binding NarL/FixJ family response regulator